MSEDQSSDPAVQSSETPVAAEPPPEVFAAAGDSPDSHSADMLDPASIEEMLKAASFEDPATVHAASIADDSPGVATEEFKLPNLNQVLQDAQVSSIELLRDVELNVKIELGRARMLVEDVLKLCEGSVVELDKLAGDPVDVFVNDRLVARGEVLVLNDNFCVRVNEILTGVKDEGQ
jgi:flagellar motor switch protein FliN/FliY